MTKINLLLLFSIIALKSCYSQSDLLLTRVSVNYKNTTILNIITDLNTTHNIDFSYDSNILELNTKVSVKIEDKTLKYLLIAVFANTSIRFISYSNQIILIEAKKVFSPKIYTGKIIDNEANVGVPFSTVKIKNANEFIISDSKGVFEIDLDKDVSTDTLIIYAFSYNKIEIPVKRLNTDAIIYLKKKEFKIDGVEIIETDYKIVVLGNKSPIVTGSMYIDTHGQQTALYIKNKKARKGEITKIKYRLSNNGNAYAPFRIRIYECDKHNKPGKDLLHDILVVKPVGNSSWFEIDISSYEVYLPSNGFFVAIEGVFPNDFNNYFTSSDFNNISEEKNTLTEYGQRLCYNRFGKNNTWHYSLSHTWFKTSKKRFNVMIKTVIRYNEIPKSK